MVSLTVMIRQLRDEKNALDATIAALEQLVPKPNGAGSKPKGAAAASSKTAAPGQRNGP